MRVMWATFGILALLFGTAGIVLPLVPTVPFLLLAAFCFAKSSPVLHDWLIQHPVLGPPIEDWRKNGAIRRSAKIAATVSIGAVFALSIFLGLRISLLLLQGVVLSCVLVFIWSRPEASS